jgi:glutaredoxin
MSDPSRRVPRVTLYGRPGCCLCEDARDALERIVAEVEFELEERDIETDDLLLARYLERIPVIAVDGVDRFELTVDEAALRAHLAAAAMI